ncbi:DUF6284 family protein [Streptomyces sp. NPDC006798]|uniref:DUF6284 family protein n=1 Tax=Streptomyces sp. NPDC006798 TaxID=3155462 RepID=UPI0033C6630F
MNTILALHAAVTAVAADGEPSAAELDEIEREMPLILAEVDELDVRIAVLDRTPTELDARRIRRARRRVLEARRQMANAPAASGLAGGAA